MLKRCGMILAIVLFLWCAVDAKVEETVELRVFNSDFKPLPKEQMLQILEQANLEANGFTKEVVSEVKSTSSGNVIHEKMHRYLKSVPCHEVAEVERQLDALLGGVVGSDVDAKIEQDMKTMKLDDGKKCRVGVEFHFAGDCSVKLNQRMRRRDARPIKIKCKCRGSCKIVIKVNTTIQPKLSSHTIQPKLG